MLKEYRGSFNKLKQFTSEKDINIINAGTSSFSPSLMSVQYKILQNEFDIYPSILVVHIDQTDLGDEFCRYKDRKIYDKKIRP